MESPLCSNVLNRPSVLSVRNYMVHRAAFRGMGQLHLHWRKADNRKRRRRQADLRGIEVVEQFAINGVLNIADAMVFSEEPGSHFEPVISQPKINAWLQAEISNDISLPNFCNRLFAQFS